MLNVLLLLSVTGWLLECSDDQRRSGGDDRHCGLTVLDGELYGDPETFLQQHQNPIAGSIVGMGGGPTQSPVAFAISSPTFFGERPRGPIFGASAEEAPTSPPVARRWLYSSISTYSLHVMIQIRSHRESSREALGAVLNSK